MPPFHRILVGVDLFGDNTLLSHDITDASRHAVHQAIWLAQRMHAPLTFLVALPDVLNPDSKYIPQWYASEFADIRRYRDDAASTLQQLVEKATREKCKASAEIIFGSAWLELIRAGVQGRHDLIMVGSRDLGGMAKLFLGSTAVKLIRKSPIPVWITHPRLRVEVGCVLAATDFSATAERAANVALEVATSCLADFHVVHACHEPAGAQRWAGHRTPERHEQACQAIRDTAQSQMDREVERLRKACAHLDVTGHVRWGQPAEAVLQVAVDRKADLIVLGSVGRTGLAGVLLGNTAEKVLREVDRSLLVVKPAGFQCPVPLNPELSASGS
jgi:nucleotide-binding universal stress UspA family protein